MNAETPKASYSPVKTRRAFEEVSRQIREQITSGALEPGDRLPSERELAEQFNLSRNTVREGLRALEIAGILMLKKGASGGAFVCEADGDLVVSNFADLFNLGMIKPQHVSEARQIIAVAVTRLACANATESDFASLAENVAATKQAGSDGDTSKRVELSLEFHGLLAKATKNPVLVVVTDALIEIHRQMLEVRTPAPTHLIFDSRQRLLQFVMDRDADGAAEEMGTHLGKLQQFYASGEDA